MARRPSQGQITDSYGPRRNPVTGQSETHHGVDINAAEGELLVAPERCRLASYGVQRGWASHGRVAVLAGESGYEHWLSHTDRLADGLTVGDWVDEGAPVAWMGLTGQTTGLHVHWETRRKGARPDPESWLASTAATESTPLPYPILNGDTMSALRVIDSPAYRAANQRVIHNGSSAMTIPAGWVQRLITVGRVEYGAYETDNDLVTEVNLVWQLGGLDAETAARRTTEMLAKVKNG